MEMKVVAVLFCAVVVSNGFPIWPGFPYYHHGSYGGYYNWGSPYYYGHQFGHYPQARLPQSRLIYYGEFQGSCEGSPDGLYFVDEYNFAYCSNGQKTIQRCAEGSANPPLDHFKNGGYYGFYDFCAVNLVAQGYNSAPKPVYPAKVDVVKPIALGNDLSKSHYVEESYAVEESKGYDNKVKDGYEAPEKVKGYKETYHQQSVYEEPKKAIY